MRAEALSSGGTQLLVGLALALGVALLGARRPATCVTLAGLQAWAIGLAVAWQGWVLGASAQLVGAALAVLAGQGILVPLVLARGSRRLADAEGRATQGRTALPLLAGLAAGALAVAAVRPAAGAWSALERELLAAALATALFGLAAVVTRRDPFCQAAGLSSMLGGAVLAVAPVPGLPSMPIALGAAALAVSAAVGAVLHRAREGRPVA